MDTGERIGSEVKSQSPIEQVIEKLFGKIENLERLTGRFIGKTTSVRVELGVKEHNAESKPPSPISPLEVQIEETMDKIDAMICRLEQALAELRL